LKPRILLSKEPLRSAPFKVLRQPGTAAVLIELGYMSNAQDEELMLTPKWQGGVAHSIAAAIEAHFNQRQAARP
jgi:N-acetylmuramoyl-L-alanine amidase